LNPNLVDKTITPTQKIRAYQKFFQQKGKKPDISHRQIQSAFDSLPDTEKQDILAQSQSIQAQNIFKSCDEETISLKFFNKLRSRGCQDLYKESQLTTWITNFVASLFDYSKHSIISDRIHNPKFIRSLKGILGFRDLSKKKRTQLEDLWEKNTDDFKGRIYHALYVDSQLPDSDHEIKKKLGNIIFREFLQWLNDHKIMTKKIYSSGQDDMCQNRFDSTVTTTQEINELMLREYICFSLNSVRIQGFKTAMTELNNNKYSLTKCDRIIKLLHSFDTFEKTKEILTLISKYYKIPKEDTTGRDLYNRQKPKFSPFASCRPSSFV
jgi:hypothetical protein